MCHGQARLYSNRRPFQRAGAATKRQQDLTLTPFTSQKWEAKNSFSCDDLIGRANFDWSKQIITFAGAKPQRTL